MELDAVGYHFPISNRCSTGAQPAVLHAFTVIPSWPRYRRHHDEHGRIPELTLDHRPMGTQD